MKKEQKVKVQFGWMVFANQKFTQVRTQKGGRDQIGGNVFECYIQGHTRTSKEQFFPKWYENKL